LLIPFFRLWLPAFQSLIRSFKSINSSACPTLGAGDPASRFHSRMYGKDISYPQVDQQVRMSSDQPDWPLASNGKNYAALYKVNR